MSTKHTPGPWDVVANFPQGMTSICFHDGKGWRGVAIAKTEANARLIAADPELLDALQNLLRVIDGEGGTKPNARELARAAIANATGDAA